MDPNAPSFSGAVDLPPTYADVVRERTPLATHRPGEELPQAPQVPAVPELPPTDVLVGEDDEGGPWLPAENLGKHRKGAKARREVADLATQQEVPALVMPQVSPKVKTEGKKAAPKPKRAAGATGGKKPDRKIVVQPKATPGKVPPKAAVKPSANATGKSKQKGKSAVKPPKPQARSDTKAKVPVKAAPKPKPQAVEKPKAAEKPKKKVSKGKERAQTVEDSAEASTSDQPVDANPVTDHVEHRYFGLPFVHERRIPAEMKLPLRNRYADVKWGTAKARIGRVLHPILSLSRSLGEIRAASLLPHNAVIVMPGARTSLRRLLDSRGDSNWRIHVCQPLETRKDEEAWAGYPRNDPALSYCNHLLRDCDCQPNASHVYLTNVVYYLKPADFARFPNAVWLSFHHTYRRDQGTFPSAADRKALGLKAKDQSCFEHSWNTAGGVLSVVVDDGCEYVHVPAKEAVRLAGRDMQVAWRDEFPTMSCELAWLTRGVYVEPQNSDAAANLLLTGRRTAVETANILTRTGVPFATAVEGVVAALPRAWAARIRLTLAEQWNDPRFALGVLGCVVLALAAYRNSRVQAGASALNYLWQEFRPVAWIKRLWRQAPPASAVAAYAHPLVVCLGVPAFEEFVVRPILGTKGLIALELLRMWRNPEDPFRLSPFSFIIVALFHFLMDNLPVYKRFACHALWNYMALSVQVASSATVGPWASCWAMVAAAARLCARGRPADDVAQDWPVPGGYDLAVAPVTQSRLGGRQLVMEEALREGVLVGDSLPAVCVGHYSSNTTLDPSVKIKIRPEKRECLTGPRVVRTGPMVAGHVPLVYKNCAHNKVTGICRRFAQAKAVDHVTAENEYLDFFRDFWAYRVPPSVNVVAELRASEWEKRFPAGKRRDFAEDRWRTTVLPTHHTIFVKSEKSPMPEHFLNPDHWDGDDPMGAELVKLDPRIICCPAAATRYSTGSVGCELTHALGDVLSAEKGTLVYPCGYTAERLGELFDEALAVRRDLILVFGDDFFAVHWVLCKNSDGSDKWIVLFLMADASRQDSHMRRLVKHANASVLIPTGGQGTLMAWFRKHWFATHDEVEIRDPYVSLTSEHAMTSGDPLTGANATATGAVLASALVKLAAAGVTKATVAGFPYELSSSRYLEEVDFLSMLWYPALKEGALVTKPGPKLGRILAKTFWHIGNLGALKCRAHLRGVVECLWLSASHIPVLNDLLLALLKDTEGVTPWGNDPSDIYKVRGTVAYSEAPEALEFMCARYELNLFSLNMLREEASRATATTVFANPMWHLIVKRDC